MTLAVYRSGDGIERVHTLADGKDYAGAIAKYEAKSAEDAAKGAKVQTVSVETFPDDSVVAYLINKRELRKKEFRDELREMGATLDGLADSLRWVQEEVEKMG